MSKTYSPETEKHLKALDHCKLILQHVESCFEFCRVYNDKKFHQLSKQKADMVSLLNFLYEKARKQLYEVAVVGTEKAGKSTLLGAWIKIDIIPRMNKRCTYTITEIHKTGPHEQARLEIHYKTKQEFAQEVHIKKCKLQETGERAIEEEVLEIENLQDEIESLLPDENTDPYNRIRVVPLIIATDTENDEKKFQDMKTELFKYIADPAHGRAIKLIKIFVNIDNLSEDVVLLDLPGYNSPITMHKEQTNEVLRRADAVMIAKRFQAPDIIDTETTIMNVSDASTRIPFNEKVVVVLTFKDQVKDSDYERTFDDACKAWGKFGVPRERIQPICSVKDVEPSENYHGHVKNSGMDELTQKVQQLVKELRTKVIDNKLKELKEGLMKLIIEIRDYVSNKTNMDFTKPVLLMDDSYDDDNEWWLAQWRNIMEQFQNYFQTNIINKELVNVSKKKRGKTRDIAMWELKHVYDQKVDKIFNEIRAVSDTHRREEIYKACYNKGGVISVKKANLDIRDEIARECTERMKYLSGIVFEYAWNKLQKLIDYGQQLLYNFPEVKEKMFNKKIETEKELLRSAFDALLTRIAYPAIDLLLQFPRSKLERLKMINEYHAELEMLNVFILKGKTNHIGLCGFLANGKHENFKFAILYEEFVKTEDLLKKAEQQQEAQNKSKKDSKKGSEKDKEKRKSSSKLAIEQGSQGQEEVLGGSSEEDDLTNLESTVDTNAPKSNLQKIIESVNPSSEAEMKVTKIKYTINDPSKVLNFSPDASNWVELEKEISEDIKEFFRVMKNSVFYSSGLERFYLQTFEHYRMKYIRFGDTKWRSLVQIYTGRPLSQGIRNFEPPSKEHDFQKKLKLFEAMQFLIKATESFLF